MSGHRASIVIVLIGALAVGHPVLGMQSGELDDLGLDAPGSTPEGPAPGGARGPDPAAGQVLPGGLETAWNLVNALAGERAHRRSNGFSPPFQPWQALRFRKEVEGVLAGALPGESPRLVEFVRSRMDSLLAPTSANGDPAVVERLCRDLVVIDRPTSTLAIRAAQELAVAIGETASTARLIAMTAHGPAATGHVDRARRLLYASGAAAWVLEVLGAGNPGSVDAVLGYLAAAAPQAIARDVLRGVGTLADGDIAARAVGAIARMAPAALLADLEAVSRSAAGPVAAAAGEAIGRIREREEAVAILESAGIDEVSRREAAARLNAVGLTLHRAGRLEAAYHRFAAASRLDPSQPVYATNAGHVLYRRGNAPDGVAAMRRAIEAGGESPHRYQVVINAMREVLDRATLIDFLEERLAVARFSGDLAVLQLNLAHEANALGQPERALRAVELAFTRAVPEALVGALLARRGDAYMHLSDTAQARRSYAAALAADPSQRRATDGLRRLEAWASVSPPASEPPRPAVGTTPPGPDRAPVPGTTPSRAAGTAGPSAPPPATGDLDFDTDLDL